MTSILQTLNQIDIPQIAEFCLRGTAAIAIAAVVVFAMRRRRTAGTRHFVWLCGLAGLAAVPVLAGVFPSWKVLPTASEQPSETGGFLEEGFAGGGAAAIPSLPPVTPSIEPAPVQSWQPRWGVVLVSTIWSAVVVVLLVRLLVGSAAIRRARRRSVRIGGEANVEMLADLRQRIGVCRDVPVYREKGRGMPMTCGIFRSAIFLPENSVDWTRAQLQSVLLHELAHVRRRDPAVHVAAQIIRVLHWFNPAVWFAWRRLEMERERACDDAAIAAGVVPPVDYAQHLLSIVTHGRSDQRSCAGVAMGEHAQIKERLGAILDERNRRTPMTGRGMVLGGVALLVLTAPLALLRAAPQESNVLESAAGPERIHIPDLVEHEKVTGVPATKEVAALEVRRLDPEAVAEFLDKVLGKETSVTADAKSGLVFVFGDASKIQRAREAIAKLQADADPKPKPKPKPRAAALPMAPLSIEGLRQRYHEAVQRIMEKDWKAAADILSKAIERYGRDAFKKVGPPFGSIHYHLGLCYYELGKIESAARQFEICYKDFPNGDGSEMNHHHALALYQWGRCEEARGEMAGAAKLYQRFIDGHPDKSSKETRRMLQLIEQQKGTSAP